MFFLHLFSGQRRPQDLQHWIEVLNTSTVHSKPVWVLSLDVANDRERGDLRKDSTVKFWMALMAQGVVVGVMAGPPCETWSTARSVALDPVPPRRRIGPKVRPVRSRALPWGVRGLTHRERVQVAVGNELLRTTARFLVAAVVTRTPALMEHPELPWREESPSSWRLPEFQWIASLPPVRAVRIDQCMFGCRHLKPTRLLGAHLPSLSRLLVCWRNAGRCDHPGGHLAAVGLDGAGGYKTAGLKEYPSELCRFLAAVFLEDCPADVQDALPEDEVPELAQGFFIPLDPYAEFEQQHDCALRGPRSHE